jgi:hypothetical protein
MGKIKDMTGQRFGRLLVTAMAPARIAGEAAWVCSCDCGAIVTVRGYSLRSGDSKSCGCLKNALLVQRSKTHGLRATSEYGSWSMMKNRCLNPRTPAFADYGGRGISVCPQWVNSFETFLSDVGKKPSSGHTLDRIDNDGNYEPGNCRWSTYNQQARNRRSTRLNEPKLRALQALLRCGWAVRDLAPYFGVHPDTLRYAANGTTWSERKMGRSTP